MRPFLPLAIIGAAAVYGNGGDSVFPVPEGMELRVHFWVNVFTRHSVMERIIHDEDAPERIYRVIDLSRIDPELRMHGEMLEALVDAEVERITHLLKKMGRGIRRCTRI